MIQGYHESKKARTKNAVRRYRFRKALTFFPGAVGEAGFTQKLVF
jgi:hypothetical protein